jgi:glycerophosphoryl diester phosphodiesterase
MSWLTEQPIAHRGLHADAIPENSLPAFEAAIEAGYPIECDVRVTEDGVPVIFHDRTLNRLTDRDDRIENLPYAELSNLSLDEGHATIPTLTQLLDTVSGRVPLLIEIKGRGLPDGTLPTIAEKLDTYEGKYAVQSFDPFVLRWFRNNREAWLRGQLAGNLSNLSPVKRISLKTLWVTKLSRPDFVGYRHQDLPYDPVQDWRESNGPVLAWTVHEEAERERIEPYADNIIFEGFRP